MSKLSNEGDLSQIYMNHSIRVTGTTYLTRKDFTLKQIMSITGHKSLNSLTNYQKVSTDEKLSSAYAMSCYLQAGRNLPLRIDPQFNQQIAVALTPQEANLQLCAVSVQTIQNPCHTTPSLNASATATSNATAEKALVLYENEDPFQDAEISDFDLSVIVKTIEKEHSISMMQTTSENGATTTNMTHQQRQLVHKSSPQIPIFQNCKVGNINITINNKKPRGFMQSCFPFFVYFKCCSDFLLYFYKCSTSMAFT